MDKCEDEEITTHLWKTNLKLYRRLHTVSAIRAAHRLVYVMSE